MIGWDSDARSAARAGLDGLDRFHLIGRHKKHMDAAETALARIDSLEASAGEHPLHPVVSVMRAVVTAAEPFDEAQESVARAALSAMAERAGELAAAGAVPLAGVALAMVASARETRERGHDSDAMVASLSQAGLDAVAEAAPAPWTLEVASLSSTPSPVRLEMLASPVSDQARPLAAQASTLATRVEHPGDRLHLVQWLTAQVAATATPGGPAATSARLVDRLACLLEVDVAVRSKGALEALGLIARDTVTPAEVGLAFMGQCHTPAERVAAARVTLDAVAPDPWQDWATGTASLASSDEGRAAMLETGVRAQAESRGFTPAEVRDTWKALLGGPLKPLAAEPDLTRGALDGLQEAVAQSLPARAPAVHLARESSSRLHLSSREEANLVLAVLDHPGTSPIPPAGAFLGAVLQSLGEKRDAAASVALLREALAVTSEMARQQGDHPTLAASELLAHLDPPTLGSDLAHQAATLRAGLTRLASPLPGTAMGSIPEMVGVVSRTSDAGDVLVPLGRAAAAEMIEAMRMGPCDPAVLHFAESLQAMPTRFDSDRTQALLAGLESAARQEGMATMALAALRPLNPAGDRNAVIRLALDELRQQAGDPLAAAVFQAAQSVMDTPELRDWPRARVGRALLDALARSPRIDAAALARAGGPMLAAAGEGLQRLTGARILEALGSVALADRHAAYVTEVLAGAAPALAAASTDSAYAQKMQSTLDEIVRLQELVALAGPRDPQEPIRRDDQEVVIGGVRVPVRDVPGPSQPAGAAAPAEE